MSVPENYLKDMVKSAVSSAAHGAGEYLIKESTPLPSNMINQERDEDSKTIILNKKNSRIMQIYTETLRNAAINVLDLQPGPASVREGISGRLRFLLEKFIYINCSGKTCKLPLPKRNLDSIANELLEEYVSFLNKLIMGEQKISVNKVTADQVESPFVLVYWHLINLFKIALDKNIEHHRIDGDLIVTAINEFVEKINKEDVLFEGFVTEAPSAFNKVFHVRHKEWTGLLKTMVETIKLLHKNNVALKGVKEYLKSLKHAIVCQLVIELDPKITKDHLNPQVLEHTLLKVEEKIIKKNSDKKQAVPIYDTDKLTNQQHQIINSINSKSVSEFSDENKKQRVRILYVLLQETKDLDDAMVCFDLFNTVGSWVWLELFKIEALAEYIKSHTAKCSSLLAYDETSKIWKKDIRRALISFDTSIKFPVLSDFAHNNLMQLINPNTKEKIKGLVSSKLNDLIDIEKKLDFDLINSSRLRVMWDKQKTQTYSAHSSSSTSSTTNSQFQQQDGETPMLRMKTTFSTNTDTSSVSTNSSTFWSSNIPRECLCPLTGEIFKDPVMLLGDQTIYERKAIEKRLIESGGISPKTGVKLTKEEQLLIPMPSTQKLVQMYSKSKAKQEKDRLRLIKTKRRLLIHQIVSNAVQPSKIRYKNEFKEPRFSKRKLNDISKENIQRTILSILLNSKDLHMNSLNWLEGNRKNLQKRLSLALVWKLHAERNLVLRDKEDDDLYGKQTFETMGIVLRNTPFGEDDGQIILTTLKARIALALDDVSFSDKSLKDKDFDDFNRDQLNVDLIKQNIELDDDADANSDTSIVTDFNTDTEENTNDDASIDGDLNTDTDDESSVESKKYR